MGDSISLFSSIVTNDDKARVHPADLADKSRLADHLCGTLLRKGVNPPWHSGSMCFVKPLPLEPHGFQSLSDCRFRQSPHWTFVRPSLLVSQIARAFLQDGYEV